MPGVSPSVELVSPLNTDLKPKKLDNEHAIKVSEPPSHIPRNTEQQVQAALDADVASATFLITAIVRTPDLAENVHLPTDTCTHINWRRNQ